MKFNLMDMQYNLFAAINTNTIGALTVENTEFYKTELIKNAMPALVHNQFGQERPIPNGNGDSIQFRRYNPLPKALEALTEGVTPDGGTMTASKIFVKVQQYGYYVAISDMLEMVAIDNNIVEAEELLGAQAGETLDTITREVLNGGSNVQFAEGQVTSRGELTGDMKLTVKAVKMAVRTLKVHNAKKINGYFVGIIHPDVAFDLTEDPEWKKPKEYCDPSDLYTGEIGAVAGVRFVETTEARVFSTKTQDEAGAAGRDVYSTLILGKDAYGTTKIAGGGLETIIKPKGSAGTADPLDQRSTVGWKATHAAIRLTEEFMVRIETGSTYGAAV